MPHQASAVITGAASGIGRSLAEALHARNTHLTLADINTDAVTTTANRLGATPITTDVTDPDAMHTLAARTPHARLICLNAGTVGSALGAPWDVPPDDWNHVFNTNVGGVINGLRAFVPPLLATGEPAHLLITASLAGLAVFPSGGAYGPSKHAVTALAEHTSMALADTPISVSMICPALVATGTSTEGTDPARIAERALHALDHDLFAVVDDAWHHAIHTRAHRITTGHRPEPPAPNPA